MKSAERWAKDAHPHVTSEHVAYYRRIQRDALETAAQIAENAGCVLAAADIRREKPARP